MNSKGAAPTRVYEDFVPSSKLVQEENFDTIYLNLPGFKKDQLKVVLTSTGTLNISGERPIGLNKWQRFQNEFPVAENCDRTKISAKFENGVLHVKKPKPIASSVKKDKELSSTLAENAPAAEKQKTPLQHEFSKQDKADIDTPAKEEPNKTGPKTSEQTEAKSLAEKKLPSEEPKKTSPKTREQTEAKSLAEKKLLSEEPKKTSPKTSEPTEAKSLAEKKLPSEKPKKTSPKTSEQTEAKILAEEKLPSEESKKTSPKTSEQTEAKRLAEKKLPSEEPKKTSPKTNEQQEAKSLAEKELPADESSSSSSSSSESESDSTDDETDDEATGYASCLAAKLKKRKVALVGLLVLGISLYVANERSH